MKGRINIEGKIYFLSAWTNLDKNKKKYLSLLATPANQQVENNDSTVKDEDLPF